MLPQALKWPLTYPAIVNCVWGTIHVHDRKDREPGSAFMQFIKFDDTYKFDADFSKPQKLQKLFAAVPADLNVKAPPEPEVGVSYKIHTDTTIALKGIADFLTGDTPLNQTFIHEAKVLTEIDRWLKANGHATPHPHIVHFKGFVTAKFDEIPANEQQERVWGIALAPSFSGSLSNIADRWNASKVAGAGLSRDEIKKIKADLRKTIDDIHAAGYAHNDISPFSVGLTQNRTVILFNFHSCEKLGVELTPINFSRGTFRLHQAVYGKSEKENDELSFKELCDWMDLVFA